MHLSTILTSCPTRLASYISRLSKQYRDHVLFFALSPNVASPDIAQLVRHLTTFSPHTIGCLSAPLPHHYSSLVSCSFAIFQHDECIPFRSQIPGREAPQVGRWHSFRHKSPQSHVLGADVPSGRIDWESVWDQSLTNNELPPALLTLSRDEIETIIYLSDSAPEGLSNALASFSRSTKLGLFAASTPFITGRSVTLFENDKIHDSGAVGLALRYPKANAKVQFVGMKPLCDPMVVTQSEGNLIISLDNKNPTQLLLAAIRQSGVEFSASESLKDSDEFSLATLQADDPHQMYSIMSGDPSRGTIALKSMSAPLPGARVQFFHRPKSTTVTIPQGMTNHSNLRQTLGFVVCPEMRHYEHHDGSADDIEHVLPNTFLAGSESGFIVSRVQNGTGESPWTCSIPGGLATLSWNIGSPTV
ncbi:hypothetical protein GGX14DRAFT_448494 [Mycena pura]|uniref:FIST domain-containing protein n=1 Tax=Mycena pura TaxID=153505 RepID=A0AAD6VHP9_9AGAR|nr:hypothetical protein GGX14DRAFT_448494 [Mycena pura]